MPAKSKAQLRLMYAVAEGKSKKVPKKVAKEYIKHTPTTKGMPMKMPQSPMKHKGY